MTYDELKKEINRFLTIPIVQYDDRELNSYLETYPINKKAHDNSLIFLKSINKFQMPDYVWIDGEDDVSFKWNNSLFEIEIGIGGSESCILVWDKASPSSDPIICQDMDLKNLIKFVKNNLQKWVTANN